MFVLKQEDYKKILRDTSLAIKSKEKLIDVYHKNNWDHFVMHWDEENRNERPSYIDFFFDVKTMVCFLREFLEDEKFEKCYLATACKLKRFDDDVCKDIYDEFKTMTNSLGLRVNTRDAICMRKEEFLSWCDRLSVGGFSGVSEYSVLIPKLNSLIEPHHHMNYLIYSNDKNKWVQKITDKITKELLIDF